MGWCKQIKFLPIGTWSHLSSKWEEMKHIRFMGLMEEGSGKAKWLRFFSALILEVSGTNHISCSPVHPVVYKSQVRVKSKSDIFFFSTWLILWSISPDGYGNGYAITSEGGHRGRQDTMMEKRITGKGSCLKRHSKQKTVHNTVV